MRLLSLLSWHSPSSKYTEPASLEDLLVLQFAFYSPSRILSVWSSGLGKVVKVACSIRWRVVIKSRSRKNWPRSASTFSSVEAHQSEAILLSADWTPPNLDRHVPYSIFNISLSVHPLLPPTIPFSQLLAPFFPKTARCF
jgi:hypothetical protein